MSLWAHLDLNQGPLPYQGSALTGLSYGPVDGMTVTRRSVDRRVRSCQIECDRWRIVGNLMRYR